MAEQEFRVKVETVDGMILPDRETALLLKMV